MVKSRIISILFVALLKSSTTAQDVPVGFPVVEDYIRRQQVIKDDNGSKSFVMRPLVGRFSKLVTNTDSLQFVKPVLEGSFYKLSLLPLQQRIDYNSHHPYGWNNDAMANSRGIQSLTSFGFYGKLGPLSIQVTPQILFNQDLEYDGIPESYSTNFWRNYYGNYLNIVDNPTGGRFDKFKILPGNSSIYINVLDHRLGLSNEQFWTGPGIRNSLQYSNNASGFNKIVLRTSKPINIFIGEIEYLIFVGKLGGSNLSPVEHDSIGHDFFNPPPSETRYNWLFQINLITKVPKGLSIGFIRSIQSYESNIRNEGFANTFSGFFRQKSGTDNSDQLASIFARWVIPKANTEIYAEFLRNDAAWNFRDFLQMPEHSLSYVFGINKIFEFNNHLIQAYTEFTSLLRSGLYFFRVEPFLYGNGIVRHGHTNKGQLLGSGIGPGSKLFEASIMYVVGLNSMGLTFEKLSYNMDFYNVEFRNAKFDRAWVQRSFGVIISTKLSKLLIDGKVLFNRSQNYQWRIVENLDNPYNSKSIYRNNLHLSINAAYLF